MAAQTFKNVFNLGFLPIGVAIVQVVSALSHASEAQSRKRWKITPTQKTRKTAPDSTSRSRTRSIGVRSRERTPFKAFRKALRLVKQIVPDE
jgi:hypothetical protein